VVGGFFGGGMGLALGMLNGSLLSNLTPDKYYPQIDFDEYQWDTTIRCAVASGIGTAIMLSVIIYGWFFPRIDWRTLQFFPGGVIVPSLIAGIAAVSMIRRVNHWYKMKVDDLKAQPEPSND
jgi:hypothetical protein